MENPMTLPETLKEWRASAGLTIEQAAVKLNVSYSSYLRWETGKLEPRIRSQIAMLRRIVGPYELKIK